MNIALVTREYSGLTKNGGIGTAVRYASEHLADGTQTDVHVYYTGRPTLHMSRCRQEMRAKGVHVHGMPLLSSLAVGFEKRAFCTFQMLQNTRHDVYIFHDFMADGFFSFQAKKEGRAFGDALLGIVTHGSSCWVDEGNNHLPDATRTRLYEMEQQCCEWADFLISPSTYLLDWMRARHWVLPTAHRRIANFTSSPEQTALVPAKKTLAAQDIREIVFFGRLEERKGVRVFCDALNLLPVDVLAGKQITFLGKEDHFTSGDIRAWLKSLMCQGHVEVAFLSSCTSQEAREYLQREGVLAIMPSLRENSPCVVSECLESGIPFITSSVGGGKELILAEDAARVLFLPEKKTLRTCLLDILTVSGIQSARPSQYPQDILDEWNDFLNAAMQYK